MSQKEMEMLEKIRALPEGTQQRFLDKLDGAAMAFGDMPPRGAITKDTEAMSAGSGESHGSGSLEPR